jgi:hypothetical protein
LLVRESKKEKKKSLLKKKRKKRLMMMMSKRLKDNNMFRAICPLFIFLTIPTMKSKKKS